MSKVFKTGEVLEAPPRHGESLATEVLEASLEAMFSSPTLESPPQHGKIKSVGARMHNLINSKEKFVRLSEVLTLLKDAGVITCKPSFS